jgi:fructose-bisphosphate aldolase class II
VLGSLETMQGDKEDGHGADGHMTREQLLTDPSRPPTSSSKPTATRWPSPSAPATAPTSSPRSPTGDILAIDRIKEIHARIPNTHLVMHGSSSVPQELLAEIREFGGDMKETYGVPVEEIVKGIKPTACARSISTPTSAWP